MKKNNKTENAPGAKMILSRSAISFILSLILIFIFMLLFYVPSIQHLNPGTVLTGGSVFSILNAGNSTRCGGINASTTLSSDIVVNDTCFTINASNIILDGAGRTILGNTTGQGVIISGFTNVTIRNMIIKNFSIGIEALHLQNLTIWNNTLTSSNESRTSHAMEFQNVTHSNISNNNAVTNANSSYPINFISGSHQNRIYNNNFTTTGNGSVGIFLNAVNFTSVIYNTIVTFSGSGALALRLDSSNHSNVSFNTIHTESVESGAISLDNSFFNNFESNNITTSEANGIIIRNAGSQNLFLNNNISSSHHLEINMLIGDTSNMLAYNTSSGFINWTGNISTNLTLLLGTTIFLQQNLVGLSNSPDTLGLNGSAHIQIQIKNLTYNTIPALLKDGERCDQTGRCNITYDSITGILYANISSFSNYSTREAAPPTVTIINPANGSNFSFGIINFNTTVRDNDSLVQAVIFSFTNVSGTPFNATAVNNSGNWNATVNVTAFTEGLQMMTVLANDSVGNYNRTEVIQFAVDRTPPNVTAFGMNISNGTTVSSGAIQFNATVNDSTTTVQSVLFGFTNNVNSSEFNVTAIRNETGGTYHTTMQLATMSDGTYQVKVYANDTLGNVNNSVANVTFTLSIPVAGPGGGGGGGVGASAARQAGCQRDSDCDSNEYCADRACHIMECTSNSQCPEDWFCVHYHCVQLFDLKILSLDSPLPPGEFLDFVYFMKNMANESGDVTLRFSVSDWSGMEIAAGADVLFIESGQQKVENADVFLPSTLADGVYQFSITLTFGKYTIKSYRTIEIKREAPLIITIVPLDLPPINVNSPWEEEAIISTNKDEPISITLERKITPHNNINDILWFKQEDRLVERSFTLRDSIKGLPAGDYIIEMIAHHQNISAIARQSFTVVAEQPAQAIFGHAIDNLQGTLSKFGFIIMGFVILALAIILGVSILTRRKHPINRELLYRWVEKMQKEGFSYDEIASQLFLQSGWTKADLHLIFDRIEIAHKIEARHGLSSPQLEALQQYLQAQKERQTPPEAVIAALSRQGWDSDLISQYVGNYYR